MSLEVNDARKALAPVVRDRKIIFGRMLMLYKTLLSVMDTSVGGTNRVMHEASEKSRRAAACGRAELLANFFGGAVWGVFRENANCGDPVG